MLKILRLNIRHFTLFYISTLGALNVIAQPIIQWQTTHGGSLIDQAASIKQCNDNGYIVGGFTQSFDGEASNNKGYIDYFLVKLSANGTTEWTNTFGGSDDDRTTSVCQTRDGGFLACGYSLSTNGDISSPRGGKDAWLIKTDADGTLIWEKSLGGSKWDEIWGIEIVPSGGYILTGASQSIDGDLSGTSPQFDEIWLIKIDESGEIIWDRTFGGSKDDNSRRIIPTSDNGFIILGTTQSEDGDITSNNGNVDIWLLKLDSLGNLQWQDTYGGSGADYSSDIMEVSDGYVVCGYAGSSNGDITHYQGMFDAWVFKIDKTGNLLWQKTFGGSDGDWGRDISMTDDGNYLITGTTKSRDGDIPWYDGIQRMWVFKINGQGDILWQQTLGGADGESCLSSQKTHDNGYVLAGYTWSDEGDVTSPLFGEGDFWVVKLAPESTSALWNQPTRLLSVAPNPAQAVVNISLPTNETIQQIEVYNLLGKAIFTQINPQNNQINIQQLSPGNYNIIVTSNTGLKYSAVFQKI